MKMKRLGIRAAVAGGLAVAAVFGLAVPAQASTVSCSTSGIWWRFFNPTINGGNGGYVCFKGAGTSGNLNQTMNEWQNYGHNGSFTTSQGTTTFNKYTLGQSYAGNYYLIKVVLNS